MDDKLYFFNDQSKEDVLDILKEDSKKPHGKDCHCTWCDPAAKEELFKLLSPEMVKEGKVDPEVYAFTGQTKEQVKELLEKAGKAAVAHKAAHGKPHHYWWKDQTWSDDKAAKQNLHEILQYQQEAEKRYPTPEGAGLCFNETDLHCGGEQPDIRKEAEAQCDEPIMCEEKPLEEDLCQFGALWRKLSGVRPREKVYEDRTVDNLLDGILTDLRLKFPDMTFDWSKERCYNQNLLINGARTRFRTEPIVAAFEAVKELTGNKYDAEEVITQVVAKKVAGLFI